MADEIIDESPCYLQAALPSWSLKQPCPQSVMLGFINSLSVKFVRHWPQLRGSGSVQA